jgi:parallel beta-helix repeat protein
VIFLLVALAAGMHGKEEGEKPEILRMLPVDAREVLRTTMTPLLVYALGPYILLGVVVCASLRISDPGLLVFLLAVIPALTLAYTPIICMSVSLETPGGFLNAIIMSIGLVVSAAWLGLAGSAFSLQPWMLAALAVPVILLCLLFNRWYFLRQYRKTYLKRPGWFKRRIVASLVAILVLVNSGATAWVVASTGIVPTVFTPEKVARVVRGDELLSGADVVYDGSLIVTANSSLEIRDSTVKFKVAAPGVTRLSVNGRGALRILNSTITADGYFRFVVYGEVLISDSTIRRTWGSGVDSGLQLKSSNATIRRSVIEGGRSHGISTSHTGSIIEDCVIQNNGGAGLLLYWSSALIHNNTIRGNRAGMILKSSYDSIRNNTIQNNSGNGIEIWGKHPILANNRIYDNKGAGILIIRKSRAELEDNIFWNNAGGSVKQSTPRDYGVAIAIYIAASIVILLIPLAWLDHRRTKPFERFRDAERQ